MVDLHAHLPQLPNAGLGAGLDLLTWLERYIFPLERGFDEAEADASRAARLAGLRGGRDHDRARLRRGLRGQPRRHVPGGRGARDPGHRRQGDDGSGHLRRRPSTRRRSSTGRCARPRTSSSAGTARDDGRLQYAVTPRFAVSCTADLLRESAALARSTGAYWQTHLSEDRGEIAEVARLFPEAIDYVDVYDRAGGLGERTVLAHAVHLSDRELARLVETGTRVAHCPASNLFLASGVMPLARYLEAGLMVGLGLGCRGRARTSRSSPRCGSGLRQERAGGRRASGPGTCSTPLDWLRMGSLGGATVLGLDGPDRLARGGQGGRRHRGRPVVRGADRGRRPTTTPTTSPAGSSSGRIRTWSAPPGSAAAASRVPAPAADRSEAADRPDEDPQA